LVEKLEGKRPNWIPRHRSEDNIVMNHANGMMLTVPVQDDHKHFSSIQGEEFLGQLSDCWLFKKEPAPCLMELVNKLTLKTLIP
jgi:hypothetical protein